MKHHRGRTLAGLGLIASILAVDTVATDRSIFTEGLPLTGAGWLVRSALVAVSAWLIVTGLDGATEPWRRTDPAPGRGVAFAAALSILVLGGTAILMVTDPETLNRLVTEDGWVEWISALAWFAAAAVLLAAVARTWRGRPLWPVRLGMLAMAGLYTFIALEEISWFQRVLDIETTGRFLENGQKEINLHNFATTFSGQSFFICTFLYGSLLAFVLDSREVPERFRRFAPLVPGRTTVVIVSAACALTYETWNIALFQFALFASLVILALTAVRTGDPLVGLTAAVAAVVQVVSVTHGDLMIRAWDESEVRESIIPIGFLVHALALWRNAPQEAPEPAGTLLDHETVARDA